MKVVVQPGSISCGECGELIYFEPLKKPVSEDRLSAIGWCSNDDRFSNITGELLHKGCSRVNKRLKFVLATVECEEQPDNG